MNKKEICYSAYCGDMAPALMVLNAKLSFAGPDGNRELAIADFYSGDGKAPLAKKPGEILTAIAIPKASAQGISAYVKFANRDSIDFPIVGAAFWADQKKQAYRIAFTAVDRKPVRAIQAEDLLTGKELNEAVVIQAAELAAAAAKPVKTSVYSPSHKRRMMGLLLQRAVKEAMRRAA
jgi:4-hydroxybenzoyl-CoA reductase subunit beta